MISRFQDTVTAQFHGHTHDDWFIVYHNDTGRDGIRIPRLFDFDFLTQTKICWTVSKSK